MTNLQLLLTIGIPSFLVILSWLSNNARLAAHDKRFEDMSKRFDDVISAQHKDALEIMRNMTALHERVAVVEANQAR
jgi:hypothetical protein